MKEQPQCYAMLSQEGRMMLKVERVAEQVWVSQTERRTQRWDALTLKTLEESWVGVRVVVSRLTR